MPVTTCRMNAISVALPKTYHQPVSLGTGCSSAQRVHETSPVRSSSQSSMPLMLTPPSRNRGGDGLDLDLAVPNPDRVLWKWAGWRARGHGAIGVVHAAVTGTQEQVGVTKPLHRAP